MDIPVEEIIVHEKYKENDVSQPNDIALLRLSKEVKYSSKYNYQRNNDSLKSNNLFKFTEKFQIEN